MNIRPIKTEANYIQALHNIEKLMNAKKDTKEGDKLDILVTLVESYEEKHHPILPPDPVEAIFQQMESQDLSRKDLEPLKGFRARV